MLGIVLVGAILSVAGEGGPTEPVLAKTRTFEEVIGYIPAESVASSAPELVLEPVLEHGYCRRGFVALGVRPGGGRMGIGQALSARGVSLEFSLAVRGQCAADATYFRPGIVSRSSGDVVSAFLGSLSEWRRSKADVRGFVVRSTSTEAITCVRSIPSLQVSALWAFQPNDGREELYRAIFLGCKDPKTGDELAATIDFNGETRKMTIDLAYDQIVRPND